jgi:hypothetical protein
MLKELPLKKEYLLAIGTVILLLIGYQLDFRKTIEAWQFHNGMKQQLTQSADITDQPQYQERKNANLDKIINLYRADTVDFRSNIISIISSVAEKENAKLTEVPTRDPLYHSSQFIIQKLDFEGDYFSLMKTLKQLQSTKGIGMIRAANFKMTANPSNGGKVQKLTLKVYLEIKAG